MTTEHNMKQASFKTTQRDIKKAIHLDCIKLIENFVNHEDPNFQIFCREWKLMHFHHIFSAQLYEVDIVHATMEVFQLCKRLLIKDNSKLMKIGSIYLLYSLYYKQPAELYVKIQVDIKTWRIIKQFIESVANDNDYYYIQVRYIFWKLVSENAFRFVESDIYYGLESFFNKEQDYAYRASTVSEENIFHNEINNLTHQKEGFIKGFQLLQNSYNNIKNIINGINENEESYVPIEQTKCIEEIANDILSINEIFNKQINPDEIQNNKKIKTIEERRSAIRKKAYSKFNKRSPGTSKPITHKDDNDEISNDGSDIVDPLLLDIENNTEHTRRISKLNQIKTLLHDPLPDDIKRELGDQND